MCPVVNHLGTGGGGWINSYLSSIIHRDEVK